MPTTPGARRPSYRSGSGAPGWRDESSRWTATGHGLRFRAGRPGRIPRAYRRSSGTADRDRRPDAELAQYAGEVGGRDSGGIGRAPGGVAVGADEYRALFADLEEVDQRCAVGRGGCFESDHTE